ncbi:hypothetical protein OSTOST_04543 [Ostertagia ostertagi]
MLGRPLSPLTSSTTNNVTRSTSRPSLSRKRAAASNLPVIENSSDFSSSEFLSSCGSACRGRLLIGGKKREKFEPLILTSQEAHVVSQVIARLEESEKYYRGSDVNELRDMVMPAECELVEEMSGRVVMFVPLHECSLHAYAQKKSFHMTEADVEPIFKQIVRILAFCHALGIIVRNLKPRKLVFDQQNRIRLENVLDCIVCDDPSDDRMVDKYCTPAFAAPEVVNRAPNFSGKACDVWSLGILLYLLLLGRYPFYDETPAGVFSKIRVAKVVLPPDVHLSAGARALIFGLLRRDPDERPTTAELRSTPWVCPSKSAL